MSHDEAVAKLRAEMPADSDQAIESDVRGYFEKLKDEKARQAAIEGEILLLLSKMRRDEAQRCYSLDDNVVAADSFLLQLVKRMESAREWAGQTATKGGE